MATRRPGMTTEGIAISTGRSPNRDFSRLPGGVGWRHRACLAVQKTTRACRVSDAATCRDGAASGHHQGGLEWPVSPSTELRMTSTWIRSEEHTSELQSRFVISY